MAIFIGTDADETITPSLVSPTVTSDPPGWFPGFGPDTLNGGAGDDLLDGGDAVDTAVYAGNRAAYSIVANADGTHTVTGTEGSDTLVEIELLQFDDQVVDLTVGITIVGTNGIDTLEGTSGDDTLQGRKGNDSLSGLQGNDTLQGQEGHDMLYGGVGDDSLEGGPGNDTLDGGGSGVGSDGMAGGPGDDLYIVREGSEGVFERVNDGTDTIQSAVSYALWHSGSRDQVENLTLTGGALRGEGNDLGNRIIGNDLANFLSGGIADDVLYGMSGDDTLSGDAHNDTLDGGEGADHMDGGSGRDTYVVDNVGDVVTDFGGDVLDTVLASISYTLPGRIENLTLTGVAAINGTGNANSNNNVIVGNSARNVLNGKGGNDTLTGGGAGDAFRFDTALVAGSVTTITDMTHAKDKIALAQSVFIDAGPLGLLAAAAFHIGAAAADASDRIVYDSATGALLYDADGTGAQAAVHFATVAPGLALAATDFRIV